MIRSFETSRGPAISWRVSNCFKYFPATNRWRLSFSFKGQEQAGLRPVLVLSNDVFNEKSGTVIAFAITSQPQKAGFPLTYELVESGLPKRSWVKISQIRTLASERLGRKIGRLNPEETDTIIEGLNEILNE
jgi:mRNA interferase MazF